MAAGLELRSGYFADRPSFLALADLLRDIFDIDIGLLDRFGGPDLTAMPSGYFDADGVCVANFSAFPMPLVVDNSAIRAVGYQSGAVRPGYRGQGLYGDLMRRTFDWAEAQGFEAHLLLTDKPDLYRPHGFDVVPQHCFRGRMPAPAGAPDARPLSLDKADDLALATRLLQARGDVSERFAVRRATQTFLLNACFDTDIRLSHLPGLGAIVAWKEEGETLRLLDVAATTMPDLASVAGALGSSARMAEILFPPDLLGWTGEAVPHHGACALMVKSQSVDLASGRPFMLAPMADF